MSVLRNVIIEVLEERELCADCLSDLRARLLNLSLGHKPLVILNFSRVRRIDSAFVSLLVMLGRRVSKAGGEIHLVCLNNQVRHTINLLHLNWVYPIHESVELALEAG